MSQFVQIGDSAYNLERLEQVSFRPRGGARSVSLDFGGENWYELKNEQTERFRDWWDHYAEVYVIGKVPKPKEEDDERVR